MQYPQSEAYTVAGATHTGAQALEMFRTVPVDLVLCDVLLEGEWDGIETVTQLLALRSVPVVYLTASTDKQVLRRALATLPAAYLAKPVRFPK